MKSIPRRAFASPDQRDCYDEAIRLGWTLKSSGRGSHAILHSPDGSATLVLSVTGLGSRSVKNNWSVLKRWQKEQATK